MVGPKLGHGCSGDVFQAKRVLNKGEIGSPESLYSGSTFALKIMKGEGHNCWESHIYQTLESKLDATLMSSVSSVFAFLFVAYTSVGVTSELLSPST